MGEKKSFCQHRVLGAATCGGTASNKLWLARKFWQLLKFFQFLSYNKNIGKISRAFHNLLRMCSLCCCCCCCYCCCCCCNFFNSLVVDQNLPKIVLSEYVILNRNWTIYVGGAMLWALFCDDFANFLCKNGDFLENLNCM
jgi:hypothetical protein